MTPDRWIETEGAQRTEVQLELRRQGRDFLLLITGGQAHVGAVALAAPDQETQVTVIPPHKEGPLARAGAEAIATASGKACAATAGIHQDDITPEEINLILENFDLALERLASRVFPLLDS